MAGQGCAPGVFMRCMQTHNRVHRYVGNRVHVKIMCTELDNYGG